MSFRLAWLARSRLERAVDIDGMVFHYYDRVNRKDISARGPD